MKSQSSVQQLEFGKPPLREVVFAISFAPLESFRASHVGAFWAQVRNDFPTTEDKQPLVTSDGFIFSESVGFPLPRVWLVHKDKNLLLQIQTGRFIVNWRTFAGDVPYPGFDAALKIWSEWWQRFCGFLVDAGVGDLKPTGAELTYVNHLEIGEGWASRADIGQVFRDFSWNKRSSGITPAGAAFSLTFEFDSVKLRTEVKSGKKSDDDQRELFVFELRASSNTELGSLDSLHSWYSDAHAKLKNVFIELTTDKIRKDVWLQKFG
jgi:uncharacterized protein (TIGR04255 family)